MLNFLRRSVKSWVAKILLGLLIISFGVWGIGDIFTASTGGTVAVVGETEIDSNRYANSVLRQRTLISRQRGEVISLATLRAAAIDRQIMAGLVRDATFAEELRTREIAIPSAAVADTIRQNPAFQDGQGGFSQFNYQNLLGQQGYNSAEYEDLTRQLLGQQILVDAIRNGSALPGAAERLAKWQGEERAISMLVLAPDTAPEPGAPSESDLAGFFEADPERFREPERRWGRYLRVDPAVYAEDLAPTDDEVRARYDADIETYTTQPTRTVEQIVFKDTAAAADAAKRLAEGAVTFLEIAAEQNTTVENLSLGTVSENDLPEASREAVFALTEPGVAGPVEGNFGPILLNVTAVETGSVRPFEEVRDEIARTMARRRALEVVPKRANEIDEVRAGGATMEEIAEKTGLPLVSFAGLAANGTIAEGDVPELAADPRFMSELQAAIDGQERDIIQLSDGGYALVMVDRIADSHVPELSAITEKVTGAWALEQRLAALEARAAELLLQAGTEGMAAIAAELGTEPIELPAAPRNQMAPMLTDDLTTEIFKAAEGDIVIGRTRGAASVVLIHVRQVTPLEGEALTERATAAEELLSGSLAGDQLEFFARALEQRHGAYVNQDVVEMIFEQLSQSGGGY